MVDIKSQKDVSEEDVICVMLITYQKRLRRSIIDAFVESFLKDIDVDKYEIETVASEVDLVLVISGHRNDVYGRIFHAASTIIEYNDGIGDQKADPKGVEIFMLEPESEWDLSRIEGNKNSAYIIASCENARELPQLVAKDLSRDENILSAAPIAGREAIFVKMSANSKAEFDFSLIGTKLTGHSGIQGHSEVNSTRTLVVIHEASEGAEDKKATSIYDEKIRESVFKEAISPSISEDDRLRCMAFLAYPEGIKASGFHGNHAIDLGDRDTVPKGLEIIGIVGAGKRKTPVVVATEELYEAINKEGRIPIAYSKATRKRKRP